MKFGVSHDRIDPGQPQQNEAHEWMHKTLKTETARPPERDMTSQQERFDAWRAEFNGKRPHEALDYSDPSLVLRLVATGDAGGATRAGVSGTVQDEIPEYV